MEKKTIGNLISALRRASGMTQRDLAEKLNVSDKAVSRWERDESAPDLTLLPLIADIFNITVDELLRGQIKNNEAKEEKEQPKEDSVRRQRLVFANRLKKYNVFMYIPVGLMIAGFIVAMICNFGFYRAVLGFWFGIIFEAAAVICALVFASGAMPSVGEEYDRNIVDEYCSAVIKRTYIVIFAVILISMPICLLCLAWISLGGYVGLGLDTFLVGSLFTTLINGSIIYEIGKFAVLPRIYEKNGISCSDQFEKSKKIGKLAKRCAIILLCSLIIPAVLLFGMVEIVDKRTAFTRGQSFDSFEEFKEYAETYKPKTYYDGSGVMVMEESMIVDIITGEKVPVSELPEAYDGSLHTVPKIDKDGKKNNYEILYSYYMKNGEIVSVEWSVDSDDRLPVTVYTVYHIAQSEDIHTAICVSLILIMCAEFLITLVIYLKKRKKIIKNV